MPYLTSDAVWKLDHLPQRLVVLGGGSIGCELGQAGNSSVLATASPRRRQPPHRGDVPPGLGQQLPSLQERVRGLFPVRGCVVTVVAGGTSGLKPAAHLAIRPRSTGSPPEGRLAHWSTILVSAFSDRASMHPGCRQVTALLA